MPLLGQCLCGQTKVTISDGSLPLTILACHCYNCRTTSGSLMSLVAPVKLVDLAIEGPELGHYRDSNTKSGNTTSRYFCRSCGAPVHTQGPSRPGLTVIKTGLFAGKMKLGEPQVEIFWANHEDWETVSVVWDVLQLSRSLSDPARQPISSAKTLEYGPPPPSQPSS